MCIFEILLNCLDCRIKCSICGFDLGNKLCLIIGVSLFKCRLCICKCSIECIDLCGEVVITVRDGLVQVCDRLIQLCFGAVEVGLYAVDRRLECSLCRSDLAFNLGLICRVSRFKSCLCVFKSRGQSCNLAVKLGIAVVDCILQIGLCLCEIGCDLFDCGLQCGLCTCDLAFKLCLVCRIGCFKSCLSRSKSIVQCGDSIAQLTVAACDCLVKGILCIFEILLNCFDCFVKSRICFVHRIFKVGNALLDCTVLGFEGCNLGVDKGISRLVSFVELSHLIFYIGFVCVDSILQLGLCLCKIRSHLVYSHLHCCIRACESCIDAINVVLYTCYSIGKCTDKRVKRVVLACKVGRKACDIAAVGIDGALQSRVSRFKRINRIFKLFFCFVYCICRRCLYILSATNDTSIIVITRCARALLKNRSAAIIANVIVIGCAVGMLTQSHISTIAITNMVTVIIFMSKSLAHSCAAFGTGRGSCAGRICHQMTNIECISVIITRCANRIRTVGCMLFKRIDSFKEPEIARSVIGTIPSCVEQEILPVKLYDIPHMVNTFGNTEYNFGFNGSGIQHAHQKQGIALTYCFSIDQCAVCSKAMLRCFIIGYVVANVSVNRENLFKIGLAGKIQSCYDFVQLLFKSIFLCIRGVILTRVG